MLLANKGINPLYCWYHKPDLTDKNGFTVAMYLA